MALLQQRGEGAYTFVRSRPSFVNEPVSEEHQASRLRQHVPFQEERATPHAQRPAGRNRQGYGRTSLVGQVGQWVTGRGQVDRLSVDIEDRQTGGRKSGVGLLDRIVVDQSKNLRGILRDQQVRT